MSSIKKFDLWPLEVTLIKAFAKGKRFFCGNKSSSLEFVDPKKVGNEWNEWTLLSTARRAQRITKEKKAHSKGGLF